MEEKKTGLWKALTNKINTFLHNKELKEKLYVIIFESDTPKGKLFDVFRSEERRVGKECM